MISRRYARSVLARVFVDEALMVGGLVALHGLDDEVVWSLIRGLDQIREQALRQLAQGPERGSRNVSAQSGPVPHPAIQEFLAKIR